MKICHFVASRGIGRGEFYVDLVNEISHHCEVHLVIPEGARYKGRVGAAVTIHEYRAKNSRLNPFLHYEIYKIIKALDVDIVHTHFAKATEIYYRIAPLLRAGHVATKHNPRKGRIFNRVKQVTAVSREVQQSIASNRVKLIYNGIEVSGAVPVEAAAAGLGSGPVTFLAVGRLDKIKAFDRLLIECSRLTFDYRLWLVGDGHERLALEKLAEELGIADKVQFFGFRPDVLALMGEADVVVVSSHSEGFSLVIVEALFYAKMLVSRAVGIAGEVLPSNLLIDDYRIAEKLSDVVENYASYSRSFQKLKSELSGRFDLSRVALEYVNFYGECLS